MASAKQLLCVVTMMAVMCTAQAAPPTTAPATAANTPPADPAITQIRKSVTFIELICKDGTQEFDVRGTGFFVSYPDSRLGKNGGFAYLVTNRHVALCWNRSGQLMQVERISLRLNLIVAEGDTFAQNVLLNDHGNVPWVVPEDDSVDLAVLPYLPDQTRFDFKMLPIAMLATRDLLSQRRVTEGEPVFFAGFFQQFPGTKRVQPIVRQGIIAMMPGEKIPFVKNAALLYLADVHVFGGNSGAPAFINLAGMHGGSIMAGEDFRVLGVVNGEIFENEDLKLELATTLQGTVTANSGVSTIVPADALKALLEDPRLQKLRDDEVKRAQQRKIVFTHLAA